MSFPQVICFGEVLWDMLPSGKMPGGAPMNVAFHLQQLGISAALISRIGTDKLGNELLRFMQESGLNTSLIQQSDQQLTGVVNVNMDDKNEVSYQIVQPVAWDCIQFTEEALQAVKQSRCFVFGSLAARNPATRETLFQLVKDAPFCVFDVNLRAPFYAQDVVEHLLHEADLVKMNEHELALITAWHVSVSDEKMAMQEIANRYSIPTLCVTRGSRGALLLKEKEFFYESRGFAVTVEDTIGSGDSFLAALMKGILQKEPPERYLETACAVGSLVATHRGATPLIAEAQIQYLLKTGERIA